MLIEVIQLYSIKDLTLQSQYRTADGRASVALFAKDDKNYNMVLCKKITPASAFQIFLEMLKSESSSRKV